MSGARLGSSPSRACKNSSALAGRQRVEPELGVVGLAAPAVLVLGTVVDQQQQAGRGQALHQAVEQGLRLGVDPVQVFKHQEQRLHLAFAQQHALEGVERVLAALRRIEAGETDCPPAGRPAALAAPAGCPGGPRRASTPAL